MAVSITVGRKELERVAELSYVGKTVNVILCSVGTTGFTANNSVAEWQTVELPQTAGYTPFSAVIQAGEYSLFNGAYVMPSIDAEFSAVQGSLQYDRVVIYIDGATYPHSVITETPNVILLSPQAVTYRISLWQDD